MLEQGALSESDQEKCKAHRNLQQSTVIVSCMHHSIHAQYSTMYMQVPREDALL